MGWTPGEGDTWRKDFSRARKRATALRADQTPSEKLFWKSLRTLKGEGAHFRRQCHVGNYVFDFACLSHRLLIELDGGVHDWPDVQSRDLEKTKAAEALGFRVLRLRNEDVRDAPRVLAAVRARLLPPTPGPSPKGEG